MAEETAEEICQANEILPDRRASHRHDSLDYDRKVLLEEDTLSHLSRIEVEIKDLQALKMACERMKLTFLTNQTTFKMWGSVPGKCDHAIRVPGAQYEVGVVKNKTGYELQWDNYQSGGLVEKLGQNAGLLKQAYAVSKIALSAKKQGYMLREVVCQKQLS